MFFHDRQVYSSQGRHNTKLFIVKKLFQIFFAFTLPNVNVLCASMFRLSSSLWRFDRDRGCASLDSSRALQTLEKATYTPAFVPSTTLAQILYSPCDQTLSRLQAPSQSIHCIEAAFARQVASFTYTFPLYTTRDIHIYLYKITEILEKKERKKETTFNKMFSFSDRTEFASLRSPNFTDRSTIMLFNITSF